MGTSVALTIAALLGAAAIVAPAVRGRALAMLAALVLTPVLLVSHVADSDQLAPLTDHPLAAVGAGIVALMFVVALAILFRRRPEAFALAVVATLPFRVPIASGGSTSNLLVPLYLVIGAGVLAYAIPVLRGIEEQDGPRSSWLEWVLAGAVVLYGLQSSYSDDTGKALENAVFFYVPFMLLFSLLTRVPWSRRLALQCLGLLVVLSLIFAGIGAVEYATRHLFLNPKVIASNQFESYFRVNSLFFDPNIYGRFLATVMVFLAALMIWTTRARWVLFSAIVLALLWAGLLLTFSQTSFAALLVGLAVLAGVRWSPKLAIGAVVVVLVGGAAFLAVAPDTVNLGGKTSTNDATSGRVDLVQGGVDLFTSEPIGGTGSGSFSREYRKAEKVSSERAVSASHTVPVTVAAEQGLIGLALYAALLVLAFQRLFKRVRTEPVCAAVAAAFVALVVHTLGYAAFLEDPLTWVLLGSGVALARIGTTRWKPAPPLEPEG
jgi:O-antigen ligase